MKYVINRVDGLYLVDNRRPPRWSGDIKNAFRFSEKALAQGAIKRLFAQPASAKIGMNVEEVDD